MGEENISLLDVIDIQTLQSLQDAFAAATGMCVVAEDKNGAVTRMSGSSEFCVDLTRKSSVGCERCKKSDRQGSKEAVGGRKPSVYTCHCGMVDFNVPIIVNGTYVGSLVGGHALTREPDDSKFRSLAKELGIEPEKYVRAIHKAPIISKEKVAAAAELLSQTVNALANLKFQRASEQGGALVGSITASSSVNEYFSSINLQMEKTLESIKNLAENFTAISNATAESVKAVENTDNIVKGIENASTQLTLIGFNASIEAKRAGAAGAGFNVIAQEVRTLADKNTKQTVEIEKTLSGIKKAMTDINEQIKSVKASIEQNHSTIAGLSGMIEKLSKLVTEEA